MTLHPVITVTPKNSALLKDVYGLEAHEYLNKADLGKIKTIFWTNNIVTFAPKLDGELTLADGSKISAAGTWFNHEMTLPTGETLSTGVVEMKSWLLITALSLLSTALGVSNLVSANIMEHSRHAD